MISPEQLLPNVIFYLQILILKDPIVALSKNDEDVNKGPLDSDVVTEAATPVPFKKVGLYRYTRNQQGLFCYHSSVIHFYYH
jgi:hypothetical protein